uniref:AlNc14C1G99 protein n=1 Tax=Albugo laibachii Nc14 TaxID=890382 RepID=F0VYU8_9STRA|nr:AlNc14C1G99 [Albugo laibachii Nc14]|eukprot:CCA13963.1 AlNc14C1G99 [Albugo laibachii Nc14]
MIDRRYHKALELFSYVVCAAMATKIVFFTEFKNPVAKSTSRRFSAKSESREKSKQMDDHETNYTHVFSGLQDFADRQMDRFFRVDQLREKQGTKEKEFATRPHDN